ncbi:heme o synthase [Bacteroidia bacterium]|nr:heme o synthase [Bacteroidia bacterium]MDC1395231.1 heme o synthase [Bacteroidia bacterium]
MKSAAIHTESIGLKAKLSDYNQLIKFRLTFTVVLSSVLGFILGNEGIIEWSSLTALIIGGFLTVASSNGINQIIEKDFDKLMTRTENRPIAQNRMSILEAGIFCAVTGIVGVSVLGLFLNTYAALLGFASLMSYAFIYTPLKRVSSLAVLVGAFPGAIPPLLGWVAATGSFSTAAIVLFLIQFFWQFPHFWAIAWILDDDYKKAGYRLLPTKSGRSKESATQIIFYSALLIPIGILPYVLGISGVISMWVIIAGSIALTYLSIKLYRSLTVKDAKTLMFASIIYNPLVLISLLIDKI